MGAGQTRSRGENACRDCWPITRSTNKKPLYLSLGSLREDKDGACVCTCTCLGKCFGKKEHNVQYIVIVHFVDEVCGVCACVFAK